MSLATHRKSRLSTNSVPRRYNVRKRWHRLYGQAQGCLSREVGTSEKRAIRLRKSYLQSAVFKIVWNVNMMTVGVSAVDWKHRAGGCDRHMSSNWRKGTDGCDFTGVVAWFLFFSSKERGTNSTKRNVTASEIHRIMRWQFDITASVAASWTKHDKSLPRGAPIVKKKIQFWWLMAGWWLLIVSNRETS